VSPIRLGGRNRNPAIAAEKGISRAVFLMSASFSIACTASSVVGTNGMSGAYRR